MLGSIFSKRPDSLRGVFLCPEILTASLLVQKLFAPKIGLDWKPRAWALIKILSARFVGHAFTACGKKPKPCHSEACFCRGISHSLAFDQREIPRFARNDKINYFFRKLFSHWPRIVAKIARCVLQTGVYLVTTDLNRPFCRVEILRTMLCSSCATLAWAEEKFGPVMASGPIRGELSSQSSIYILVDAQGKRIPASRCARFPHFHSDGYYYGLYPYYKTGYSSPSQ